MSKLKIAKIGYDAGTELDERNFKFNSKNVFKIAFTGNLSVSVHYIDDGFGGAIGEAENSFTHGLGYVPIGFAFDKDTGGQIPMFWHAGAGVAASISYRLDNNKIYISVSDTGVYGWIGDTIVFNFRYQIMYDKIA